MPLPLRRALKLLSSPGMSSGPLRSQLPAKRWRKRAGFTLIEMLAVLAIIGMLLGIVAPRLQVLLKTVKVTQAIGDINAIEADVIAFSSLRDSLPSSLASVGWGGKLDPWGNPYQYLPYDPTDKNPKGARKDRSLHPLNSDFDLYSMGEDGASVAPITAKVSQDDIIRANDGGFIGLARLY